jgi:bifunctional enzyme CysN/CysC
VGTRLTLKIGTEQGPATLSSIEAAVDSTSLEQSAAQQIERNQVADVTLTLAKPVAADTQAGNPRLGRFVLEAGGRIRGGGIILRTFEETLRRASPNVTPVASAVSVAERMSVTGHRGAVVWLTGLPSSGKSTIGRALERLLFDCGCHVVLLDGDTLRTGLNGDLGFTDADRAENVRRTAEVASFLAHQGQIAIVALVSPLAADRALARGIGGASFFEVHVHASVDVCASRDPKGLYARAKAGEIKGFTGISAPYERPDQPDVIVETDKLGLGDCVNRIAQCLEDRDVLKVGKTAL